MNPADVCSGYDDDHRRCKLKLMGLVDRQPSSSALGSYCEEHSCHKCGVKEEMDYCRRCVCASMSCYEVRSATYKKSVFCTAHTCPKCQVRDKKWDARLCPVC